MNLSPQRTRRLAQIALGVLWLLDGALQLQPYLLGRGFAAAVIGPAGHGQPLPISAAVSASSRLILTQTVVWDALFATVQIGIGLLILSRRTARLGLAVSFPWALGVWVFGEAAGQVLNGGADLLTGAPGAVLLYLLVGVCVWPTGSGDGEPHFPGRRLLDAYLPVTGRVLGWLWAAVWASGALLRALPGANTSAALSDTITGGAGRAPGWLAGFDHTVAGAVSGAGRAAPAAVVGIYLVIAAVPFVRSTVVRAAGTALALFASLFIWVVGENFGALYSLQSTDPNSGPLLLLFAVVVFVAASNPGGWRAREFGTEPYPARRDSLALRGPRG